MSVQSDVLITARATYVYVRKHKCFFFKEPARSPFDVKIGRRPCSVRFLLCPPLATQLVVSPMPRYVRYVYIYTQQTSLLHCVIYLSDMFLPCVCV